MEEKKKKPTTTNSTSAPTRRMVAMFWNNVTTRFPLIVSKKKSVSKIALLSCLCSASAGHKLLK